MREKNKVCNFGNFLLTANMKFHLFTIILYGTIFSNAQNIENSFVDPNVILQEEFEGWGTSLAWWADVVGGMDSEVMEHVVDALFSPDKLNLNILRYAIGGTTPDTYICGDYRDGAATESFRDGPDTAYNWTRDVRQRRILESAKAKGANRFEAFSNSPPQWLTISGCSKGNNRNPPLHSNFDSTNSAAFVDYATEVIKYFHETQNITFTSYAPFNEPFGLHGIGSWAGNLSQQEGCNMDRPTMVSIIQSVHEAIVAKDLSFLKIAISDETQVNTQIQSYDYFVDAGVSDMFSQVNVHGYWDQIELSRKDLLSMRCSKAGYGLWMDEMGWGGTPAENMEQGLSIATRFVEDLRKMSPSAWGKTIFLATVYWQVVESGGGWGLLTVPYENTTVDIIEYNSGYYAMEQFSQHITQGSKLIHTSDENSIAALDLPNKKLVIVTVNSGNSEISQEFDLGLFNSVGPLTLFRTSSTEQHLNLPPPTISAGNKVQIVSPPQSISTLEVSDVVLGSGENLVQNGDFESIQDINGTTYPTAWTLEGGTNNNGITAENSWRGEYSGILQIRLGVTSALVQNVTLDQKYVSSTTTTMASCTLYLSAWCSSSQGGTKLGVKINGGEGGPVVEINRNGAYSSYGVSFSANTGDNIQVYFENTGALLNGMARIDNVFLHMKCNV